MREGIRIEKVEVGKSQPFLFLWEKYNEIIEHRRSGCNGRHYDAP